MARRSLLVAAALIAVILPGGCAAPPQAGPAHATPTAALPSSSPTSTPDRVSADRFAQALEDSTMSHSYTIEPKGDIATSGAMQFYVSIRSATATPAVMAVDVEQLYLGADADREAARDHQPAPPSADWTRNGFHHVDRLKVDPHAAVALQKAGGGMEGDRGYGATDHVQMTSVTWQEFVRRLAADPDKYSRGAGYVINYDGESVTSIVQVYFS